MVENATKLSLEVLGGQKQLDYYKNITLKFSQCLKLAWKYLQRQCHEVEEGRLNSAGFALPLSLAFDAARSSTGPV